MVEWKGFSYSSKVDSRGPTRAPEVADDGSWHGCNWAVGFLPACDTISKHTNQHVTGAQACTWRVDPSGELGTCTGRPSVFEGVCDSSTHQTLDRTRGEEAWSSDPRCTGRVPGQTWSAPWADAMAHEWARSGHGGATMAPHLGWCACDRSARWAAAQDWHVGSSTASNQ